jgi:hypothetical protein
MSRRAIVTIVTRNYLAYARALIRQCVRHEPDVDRFVVVVDRLPADAVPGVPDAEVLFGDELGIQHWPRFAFQYTPFELACALKPHAISHLMHVRGYEEILYLDADMALYGPLSPVWEALTRHSLVLTPHLHRPMPEGGLQPHESLFTFFGTFNGGVCAVRNTDVTRSFTRWWMSMLNKGCIDDPRAGIFVDQRWLCLVPGLFPDVGILRHAGMNAGHWSLRQFTWESRPTGPASTSDMVVDGHPLVLFHFTGMTPHNPTRYLAEQRHSGVDDVPWLKTLVESFHADVHASGSAGCVAWGCALDTLGDGTPIRRAWREAIRREEPDFADVENPFDVAVHIDLPSRFRAIERRASTWRPDWRVAWEPERNVSAKLRRLWERVSGTARSWWT